jgi:phage tail sheath protein FI
MYKHGVYVQEVPTSIIPPRSVSASMPVVFGTSPVHRTDEEKVNEPVICYNYAEAVKMLGYDTDWKKWSISEFIKSMFSLFNVAPVVFINVFDPKVHQAVIEDEEATFIDNKITCSMPDIIDQVSMSSAAGGGGTNFVQNEHFTLDSVTGEIEIISGDLEEINTVFLSYAYADPTLVTVEDIKGSVDAETGKLKGLHLVNEIFPKFRLVPGQIVCNGWSKDAAVAAEMHSRAESINGVFKCLAIIDIDDEVCTKYSDVPEYKNKNNLVGRQMVLCWPSVKLGEDVYNMSSQVAPLIARTDGQNSDIPYKSPSNENLQMTSAVINGSDVWLGLEQANYLNGNGIVTCLNLIGGWKLWGNRTGIYPGSTDVKDSFIPVRRMFNWIGNTLALTYYQKVDFPLNKRLIETIVDSANIWLNGLTARQFILGGRVEVLLEENPTTDLMDGNIKFHVFVTPPSPAKEIDWILEYDPKYLETLF